MAKALFSTPEMTAVFSGASHLAAMLRFEGALAAAQARAGLIPPGAADQIAAACQIEHYDVDAIWRDTLPTATPAIPLVRSLTAGVVEEGSRYVHWGATSQDAIDTALVLQIRDGLALLDEALVALAADCAALAERYRGTLMPGRTLLQQALPTTFGLKAARWLVFVTRRLEALRALRPRVLVVQLGGAVGTLASFGDQGIEVMELLAAELDLAVPELPWHTERDRIVELATQLGVLSGGLAKIATDVVLLAQTEVGEVAEGAAPGKGGSSTLPQKRNPVDAVEAIAAARLALGVVPVVLGAMIQEHERATGSWQAEWVAIPDLFGYVAGALERTRAAVAGLEVDRERMRVNLEQTGGLLMAESLSLAIARRTGKERAHHLVQALAKQVIARGIDLRTAALADEDVRAALDPPEIDRALDPASYLGSADTLIDRALARYRKVCS